MTIRFDRRVCGDLESALTREWLETNGLGGFASSTIVGLNTRRYHGLLTAALHPPVDRYVLLSKIEETVTIGEQRFDLSANEYPGVVHPQGHVLLREFRLDPFPIFAYELNGVRIEKSLFMLHGESATVVQYRLARAARARDTKRGTDVRLSVRPLIAFRDFHSLTHENDAVNPTTDVSAGRVSITPYVGLPSLHVSHDADRFDPAAYWYRSFQYRVERARGLDYQEDLFSPFALTFDFKARRSAVIVASLQPFDLTSLERRRQEEIERRRRVQDVARGRHAFARSLTAVADHFVVARGDSASVIAGYHWFSDWGRDTMIALPGLTWLSGRSGLARQILLTFARHVDEGMIPNRFPDQGRAAPEYNTVDATLWFVEAVRALADEAGDHEFVRAHLYEALIDILAWHERGTRYGIRLDGDGLLVAGTGGTQLTWMDARVGDRVVTPRHGKPVEVQALWYNALRTVGAFARRFRDVATAARYREISTLAARTFGARFWNVDAGCLYDVVDRDGGIDASVRPNQIFAVSLRHSILARDLAKRVVDVVQTQLLTPYGLRTLAPTDPQYCGRYEGDVATRDARYHQGTVWPWLMGPFVTAYLNVHRHTPTAKRIVRGWLAPLQAHLCEAGLGQISEIFDGDAPHTPRGCIAQAWSVAELRQALHALDRKPKNV
jgi:predicted glycogen debranching enzyme